jgi:hypothetical protein
VDKPVEFAYSEDSPIGILHSQIAAELAGGRIRPTCPHPDAADRLGLPSRTFLCAGCSPATIKHPDNQPGECAACGAADGCLFFLWLDESARVVVTIRACPACMRTGNVSIAGN